MAKRMKTTKAKKAETNVLVIPAQPLRLRKPPQRAATFGSGKDYNRKSGKTIPND